MRILLLNGSPRAKGNTAYACETLQNAFAEKYPDALIETARLSQMRIAPCLNCDACRSNGGICVQKDDGMFLAEQIMEADILVFATPVYWWGISAQLKTAIDRMYAKGDGLVKPGKKVFVVATGADEITGEQYELIGRQFACICEYLKWDLAAVQPFSAAAAGDLEKQAGAKEKLLALIG